MGAIVSGFLALASFKEAIAPITPQTQGETLASLVFSVVCAVIFFNLVKNLRQKETPAVAAGASIDTVKDHLRAGDEINAIKAYRAMTGKNLKEAQAAIAKLKTTLSP
jgi:ribosomal protein L7/L12